MDGGEADVLFDFDATGLDHREPFHGGHGGLQERRLADPAFPTDDQRPTQTGAGRIEQGSDRSLFCPSPDEFDGAESCSQTLPLAPSITLVVEPAGEDSTW